MSPVPFSCRRCGHCCLNLVDAYRGCVSDADLALWRREGRSDILAWVETLDLGRGNYLHSAWIDPTTGEDVERCPWLPATSGAEGFSCLINDVKPEHCRNYPEHRRHAEGTGCPGFSGSSTLPVDDRPIEDAIELSSPVILPVGGEGQLEGKKHG